MKIRTTVKVLQKTQIKNLLILLSFSLTMNLTAELKMPEIFSNNMVLQRESPLPIWGYAVPQEKVTISFKGQEKVCIAATDGNWTVKLAPLQACAVPARLTISTTTDKKEFRNVIVGDVWLCSGQSNMAVSFKQVPEEALGIKDDELRFISQIDAGWQTCATKNLQSFSRVAYYFGAKLRKELGVPIGLINISRGCSSIEAWMTPESFTSHSFLIDANRCRLSEEIKKFQEFYSNYMQIPPEEKERILVEHCKGNYTFARRFLEDGRLKTDKYKRVLQHMTLVKPAFLYNLLIAPVIPFGIKGIIWYQGETNRTDRQYAEKQRILIESWRKLWGEKDFPFYIVQIAPSSKNTAFPSIWLQQYEAVSATSNSGIVSTIDIAFPCIDGIHPTNKRDVGLRLALLALKNTYGMKNIVSSGPVYKSIKTIGDKIIVSFDNPGSGLNTKDANAPDSFEIAGKDKKFIKANAEIVDNTVVVNSPSVPNPVFVRYAWYGKINPNLQNKEGLPAFPFDTSEAFFSK